MSRPGKIKAADILKIREMYATGKFTHKQLGELFGITAVYVGLIVTGKTRTDPLGRTKKEIRDEEFEKFKESLNGNI